MAKSRTADPNATYVVNHAAVNVYDSEYDFTEARNRGLVRTLKKDDEVSGHELRHADIVRLTEGTNPALKPVSEAEAETDDLLGEVPFDPSTKTVDEVNAHLASADDDEKLRVLTAENEGQGRKGILEGPHAV